MRKNIEDWKKTSPLNLKWKCCICGTNKGNGFVEETENGLEEFCEKHYNKLQQIRNEGMEDD